MEELLGRPLHFRVKVAAARGLPRALCRGVRVRYAHDDGDGRGAREREVGLANPKPSTLHNVTISYTSLIHT